MSRFEVDLTTPRPEISSAGDRSRPFLAELAAPQKWQRLRRALKIFGVAVIVFVITGAIGGYFYWQSLKTSPQYSLALLVDAARRDDQAAIDALVDTDAVVEDFLPQITDKAVEMYGRGMAAETIKKLARIVAPLMPAVKERARDELPVLIREKTAKFANIPFWAIALGARWYMDISEVDGKVLVKSKLQNRPLELTMKQNGDRWQVVAVRDEMLAQRVAEKVGQEIIAIAGQTGKDRLRDAGKEIGIDNLKNIFDQTKDILNR